MSHRANLIRKYPERYKDMFPDTPQTYVKYRYIWPTKLNKDQIKFLKQNKNKTVDITQFSTAWE